MSVELLVAAGGVTVAVAAGAMLVQQRPTASGWHGLQFGREIDDAAVRGFVWSLASDRRRSPLVFELHAQNGAVGYRFGGSASAPEVVTAQLHSFCPGVAAAPSERELADEGWAWSVRFGTRHRPLRIAEAEVAARSMLTALGQLAINESVVVQWIVGRRLPALAVSASQDTPATASMFERTGRMLLGTQRPHDAEQRRALRDKVSEPGFRAACRIGVSAGSRGRAQSIALNVLAALRVLESPGVRLRLATDRYSQLVEAREPWRWPLALNVSEAAAVLCWPIGDGEYQGVDRSRSRPVRAARTVARHGRVLAEGTFPGETRQLALSAHDALLHLHVLGPTGVGKSTLLLNLIVQDMAAGRGVVVIDPKGDLVAEVIARVPVDRRDDVVVLDPADAERPVGLNPLRPSGRMPELVADQVLAVFHGLYRDNWGPRTQDILHASLLTLIGRDDATLCALPMLLSDASYRRRIIGSVRDEIALGPFWSWFESISDGERQQAIAPVMNKLRPFLLRPRMRAVLGQSSPAFDLGEVFTGRKIVLVSLAKGLLGPEASALLGSLVVSQLWNATLGRTAIPAERRHPVMCFIDEFQDYLHLPTDLADVLAQARGLGLGLTLAHQHLAQLTPTVRQAVLANARSRVCFQLEASDATVFARDTAGLDVSDFTSLGRFEVYASLAAGGQITGFASGRTTAPVTPVSDPSAIRDASRERYGRDVAEVEAALAALSGSGTAKDTEVGRRPRRQS